MSSSAARCRARDAGAVALTDHQGLYGAIRFYQKALDAGIKPIIGAEVVVETAGIPRLRGRPASRRARRHAAPVRLRACGGAWLPSHAARHATSPATATCAGSSPARTCAQGRGLAHHALAISSAALRASSGFRGVRAARWAHPYSADPARARAAATRLAHCFAPGDFYVELMHLLTPESPRYIAALVALADSLGPASRRDQQRPLRHAARASASTTCSPRQVRAWSFPGPYDRPNGELWLKPAEEMRALFRGICACVRCHTRDRRALRPRSGTGRVPLPGGRGTRAARPRTRCSPSWRGAVSSSATTR